MAEKQKIRVRLKAYDHEVLDQSTAKIVQTVERTSARVQGPVPLPTEKHRYTVVRGPHKHKDSREHFEMRVHKRLLDIVDHTPKTLDALQRLDLPAGLDIEILDRYTGQARDARTLSGGESFQASLSLAFGLSDVVQQHVGGVHLDCIFVDEGFGSLDPEALDNALAMLKELQVNGRLVGIISHVGDLRQHIDARLTLTRTPNGSTATFHL